MDLKEYISSGILELYVYGTLPLKESIEVSENLRKYPEIKTEVEEIEQALQYLGSAVSPYNPEKLFDSIKQKIESAGPDDIPVIQPRSTTHKNWAKYLGWAASILLLIGLFALLQKQNQLQDQLKTISSENKQMEQQIEKARDRQDELHSILQLYRNQELTQIALRGQKIAPKAYVNIIWDKENQQAFIDAKNLPAPPPGKVYQVWSLTMNPLKPTSLGLLKDFEDDQNKIFVLPNSHDSEAFGITLEPEGGSETPSMDQLYVLGAVSS